MTTAPTSVFANLASSTSRGASSNLSRVMKQDDEISPEWGASGIYGLITVQTPDGRDHLIGTVAKRGYIYDFTDGKIVYDFTAATGGTIGGRSGSYGLTGIITSGDTYDSACYWRSPTERAAGELGYYYFGGWITGPALPGVAFSANNKFTYLVRTRDLVNWQVLIKDQGAGGQTWRAELTGLVPTHDKLFIMRADSSGPNAHLGLYSYDGTAPDYNRAADGYGSGAFAITLAHSSSAMRGAVFADHLIWHARGSSAQYQLDLITGGGVSTSSQSALYCQTTGLSNITAPDTFQGSMAVSGGALIAGAPNGYIVTRFPTSPLNQPIDITSTDRFFVPALIRSGPAIGRAWGWRGGAIPAAGGLVMTVNAQDPEDYTTPSGGRTYTTNPHAFLVWIGPGGQCRVLASGGHFSGLTVHGDRLYYGVTEQASCNRYTNYLQGAPTLASIPVSDIAGHSESYAVNFLYDGGTAQTRYVAGTSGVSGMLGGLPTLGYRRGTLRMSSTVAGTMDFYTWSSELTPRKIASVTFTAGETKIVDLTPMLDGNLLGFTYSVDTSLEGSATFV